MGRGRGVARGVTVGVAVGVTVGLGLGVTLGVAVGVGVSMMAAIPGRKDRAVERKHKIAPCSIDRARLWKNAQHLRVIGDSMAKHSDIR